MSRKLENYPVLNTTANPNLPRMHRGTLQDLATASQTRRSALYAGTTTNILSSGTLLSGMRYDRVGTRRGNASILDKETVLDNAGKRAQAMGEGRYRMMFIDDEGRPVKDSVYEHNGRAFASKNGVYNFVDGEALRYKKQIRDESNAYYNSILELVIDDDQALADVLGVELGDLYEFCAPNKGADRINNMNPVIESFNCYPSYLDTLSPDSKEYAGGIAKLKLIIKDSNAIVDFSTMSASIAEANNDK